MAIRVSCPSCQSDVHVDDTLAGKDILCPSCKQRVTVPSLAAGRPESLPTREDVDDDDRIRAGRGDSEAGLPRWRHDDDYDLPTRQDSTRWNATLTGLALIFWNYLLTAILGAIFLVISLILAGNPQAMAVRPGAQPPPELVAFGLISMGLGCIMIILFIIAFVGMCMCCTVPSESGAKGRAITSVILVGVSVVLFIIFIIAVMVQSVQMVQQMGAPPPPGQMPFSPAIMMVVMIVGVLDLVLLVTMWLMFHKAIADYFQNKGLARLCVMFILGFVVYEIGSMALNFVANPMFQGGNVLQVPMNTPWMIVATIWGAIWGISLTVGYLYIVRETRRTIREDQAADGGDAGYDERG